MSDPCPNCGRDDFAKQIYVKEKVGERIRTFIYCDVCPVEKEEKKFPTFSVKGSKNGTDDMEGIKRLPDYRQREEDSIALLKKRHTVMCGYNSGRMKVYRDNRVSTEFNSVFGNGNWKIVRDNGFEAVAEKINET